MSQPVSGEPGAAGPGDDGLLDVVDTWEQARRLRSPPLIVREGLRDLLATGELPVVWRIDEGHSNATFFVQTPADRCILRRPPRPPFEPKAHDVLREYRFLAALRDQPVRVPVPLLSCKDEAVIGAPFYLMQALEGVALRDHVPGALDREGERARVGEELVDALVELHAVDPAHLSLGRAGVGTRYLERQLALWSSQWERNQTRPLTAVDELARRLAATTPSPQRVTVVHGDYKLDNVLFAPSAPAKLLAVLDWEMATIGDPLADLGYLTGTWRDPGEDPGRLNGLSAVTAQPGFPTRRELALRYAGGTGAQLDHLAWYQALALWKLAILLEASYRRFLAGTTSDAFFDTLKDAVPTIAEEALNAASGALL
jgi:aminoglycoside phosphotransferase (APT) family kinase protein